MTATAFTLFETSIGWCGMAWSELGIVGLQLPEANDEITRSRMRRQYPEAVEQSPSQDVDSAICDIRRLLKGEPSDLSILALDMTGVPDFDRRVYEITRTIPPGETVTYGEIAARLGDTALSRAVGQALGRNPFVLIVPCHRVLAVGGRPGGFSAAGGVATKRRLLEIEGARGLHPTLPGL
jgi:methylated-DNA-[protein]-cysteine S-methyltransferase